MGAEIELVESVANIDGLIMSIGLNFYHMDWMGWMALWMLMWETLLLNMGE